MTYKLLIVDDEVPNLRLLERLFAKDFHCLTAASGTDAIRLLEQHDVAIVITDQRMPGMTGIELLKRTARLRPHMVRILLTGYTEVEALVEAINSGLVYMYITKPWNNDDLKLRVNRACEHYQNNKNRHALADAKQRLELKLSEVKVAVVNSLTEMLRTRNEHAATHALRVRRCAMQIGATVGLTEQQAEDLSMAALLHHLGRVDSSCAALSATKGSSAEQTAVQTQTECERKLVHSIGELASVTEIIDSQRENYDGSGEPRGLGEEQIPLTGRILRLADEYDQMVLPSTSAPMTHEEVMRFVTQRAGKQFDPAIVKVLAQLSSEELGEEPPSLKEYGENSRQTFGNVDTPFADAIL